jgi:hypothetical protein
VIFALHMLAYIEAGAQAGDGAETDDAPIAHDHARMLEHDIRRLDGYEESSFDQEVCGFRGGHRRAGSGTKTVP